MAVTFTSHGYDTTTGNPYTEIAWADAHPVIGSSSYGVRGGSDWKVTAVAGADRTVTIAPGFGWGHGVTDETVANETIQLDTVTSGSRWDLIVARRDWTPTAGETKFLKINGGSTKAIPGGRLSGPGNIDDQPLALVQVTAGQTQPTAIVDLRSWASNGGMVAKDDLVKSYLDKLGTCVYINGTEWRYIPGANDVPQWVTGGTIDESNGTMAGSARPVGVPLRTFTGLITVSSGAGGDTSTATPATNSSGVGALFFGTNGLPTFSGIYSVHLTGFHPVDAFLFVPTIQAVSTSRVKYKARRLDGSGWANGYASISMFVTVVGW